MRAKAVASLGFGYRKWPRSTRTSSTPTATATAAAAPKPTDRLRRHHPGRVRIAAAQQQLTGAAGYVGTILADKVAGLTALYATMMALFDRERTGQGQEVEIGMFETMASFMLVEHANAAMFTPPLGGAGYPRALAPNRKPYRTKDGHISALVYNDKQWAAFVGAVHPPGPATTTPRWRSGPRRSTPSTDCWRRRSRSGPPPTGWSCPRGGHPGRPGPHARRAVRRPAPERGVVLRDRRLAGRPDPIPRCADLVFAHTWLCRRPRPGTGCQHTRSARGVRITAGRGAVRTGVRAG